MKVAPLEPTPEELERLTRDVVEFVLGHVTTLAAQPAHDLDGAASVTASFRETVPEHGFEIADVLARLRPAIDKSFNTAGPGYLAFIPGGGLYTAALADFIACAVNRYVGVSYAAPALVEIERTAVAWLAEAMGYDSQATGILTSGGSLANFSAVVTARAARLPEDFAKGSLYVSQETHHSVAKAARLAGFPAAAIRSIAVDARFRMDPDALEAAVRDDASKGRVPFLVVASVGTTNTGAVDPLRPIADVAKRHRLWLHADAAYGGFFRLADPSLTDGIEVCDSITIDPHKGLFLPYGTGCLLVRDRLALKNAHRVSAHYLQDVVGEDADAAFCDLSPELSRDFRGLRIWLPLQVHGLAAFREALREKLALTRWAHERLVTIPSFEILDAPQLTAIAFRLKGRDDDANEELLRRVNARKRVFLSSTRIRGRYTLRLCVLSFRTHLDRVSDAVDALREEAEKV